MNFKTQNKKISTKKQNYKDRIRVINIKFKFIYKIISFTYK